MHSLFFSGKIYIELYRHFIYYVDIINYGGVDKWEQYTQMLSII